MHWIVVHIVGGNAFFTGTIIIVAGTLLLMAEKRWVQRSGGLLSLLGAIFVAISSTPLPVAFYATAIVVLIASLGTPRQRRWTTSIRWSLIGLCLCGALWEFSFRQLPTVSPVSDRSLTIIGDSITAGLGSDQDSMRWPDLLRTAHNLEVQEISRAGATAAKARELVDQNTIAGSIVIVEIGGNDLLGSTPLEQFAVNLEQLLDVVCRDGRQTLMFELPLPPFSHHHGRIQRGLAARYGVQLIPKRILLGVLSDKTHTTDGLHLSPLGHQKMTEAVWSMIESAYATSLQGT